MKSIIATAVLAMLFSVSTATAPAFKIMLDKKQVKRQDSSNFLGSRKYPGTFRDLEEVGRELRGEARD
jgi:hypothetical protein